MEIFILYHFCNVFLVELFESVCHYGCQCYLHAGGGSVLGSKSASSCPGGGSTVSPDKSFEEMRFEHFHETVTGSSPALEGAEEGCLPMRLLWILGRFLDCEPIRSAMIDLVCRRRSEGGGGHFGARLHLCWCNPVAIR